MFEALGKPSDDIEEQPPTSRRSIDDVGAPSSRSAAPVALQMIDELRMLGIDTVFGIPGGAVAPLYSAMMHRSDVRIVNAKHETGAVFLAMGYAIATGRPGVVVTTAGPGITNALTGLASAYYDSVPIVHIAGEVSTSAFGRGALQESSSAGLDAVSLVRRMTKFAAQVARPDSATAVLRKAVATSMSGRQGPVFISLPINVGSARAANNPISGNARTSFDVDASGCERSFDLLAKAQSPLILAGAGVRDKKSRDLLVKLAEAVDAPVAVSPKGKGVFPEDHENYLGVFGFGGHESVVDYLTGGVDVLLVCGSGLNDFSTNAWSPLLSGTQAFIQIDIDAAQLGKNYPIDLGLVGPADAVLSRMLSGRNPRPERRRTRIGTRYQHSRRSPTGALTTAEVMQTMNEVCPADSVFTADMGEHLSIALHYLKVRRGGDFLTCLGFGSMGSGVCTAIGYQMGAPRQRVYSVCGDGCFLMFGAELATAVHHSIPVTFIIINDSKLNMCELGMRDLFGSSPDMSTPVINFADSATAMGATGYLIRTREELIAALRTPPEGPVVLDVRIDPEIRLMGSQRNSALRQFHDGNT
ncbi:Acetolactate synthase large subunit protein [Minicystis rosea]|nr:Acetolactate synthase large subunit protein [Minicystis rosea]